MLAHPTQRITVPVTADHIRQGQPCYETRCPVALALREAGYDARVKAYSAWITVPDSAQIDRYWLSAETAAAIAVFDMNGSMPPFTAELVR